MVALTAKMNELDSEAILTRYLAAVPGTSLSGPLPSPTHPEIRALLMRTPRELAEKLDRLHSGYRICLNLSDLTVEDVLEMLYDCRGMITHLEIFNLKDHVDEGRRITRIVTPSPQRETSSPEEDDPRHTAEIESPDGRTGRSLQSRILRNIPALQAHYRASWAHTSAAIHGPIPTGMAWDWSSGTLSARKKPSPTWDLSCPSFDDRLSAQDHIPRAVSGVMKNWEIFDLLPIISRWGRTTGLGDQGQCHAHGRPGNVVPWGASRRGRQALPVRQKIPAAVRGNI